MVIRSPIRSAIRGPLRGALESRIGQDNGLSISAPSAVLFADGDQPIELWDYEAHNLLPYSADLTNWTISTGAASATTLQDENASAVVPAQQLAPQVEGRTYRISVRVDQDAVASSTRFAAIGWYQQSGIVSALVFDTSDADNNYGLLTDRPQPLSYSITDVGPGTYWDIEIVFESEFTTTSGGVILYGAIGAQIDLYNSGAFRTAAAYVAASATTGGGANLVGIVRSQFADASSPKSYVATTGTASTLTASYGDIQFADAQYDSGADSYKVTLSIGNGVDEGDMTLQTVSGLTFTPTTGGDGTADASMEFTGTLAACLAALRGISVDNVAVGTVDLDVLITHVASGRTASKTISVTSVQTIAAQSFEFGALTREGAGAVTVVSTADTPSFSITAGDASGHWQINSSTGALSPSATGEDALTGTYNLTVSDGSDSNTITVTLNADEFSVLSAAESDAAVLASSDGDTIRWRSGLTITGARIDYAGLTPVTSLTIACDTNRGTTLPGIDLSGSERVTIQGLKINRDWQSGDSTANFVIEAHQTVDCVINDNEIWSTDLSTITPQLNAEVINGVGCTSGANETDGLTITNNFIHDVWRPVSAVGPNITVQGNTFLDCFQNFGEFGNATDLVYKDNRGDGVWANGTDTGNPHSSLLGFSASQTTDGILVEGNILVTGSNRFDALADKVGLASGPKFNDTTTDQMFYTNCICRYNAFVPTDSIGLEISLGSGFNIHHNLIALDPSIYSSSSPSLQWHDVGVGSKAWANIAVVMSEGADRGNGVHADMYTDSFDNIVARPVHASFAQSGEAFSYPELFDGPTFTGLTSGQIEAAFTAKSGSRLLAPSINIGPFGTGYYNFSTGVETAPTYAKPITTTATGIDLVGVIFDGTNDYATITDETDPLLGMSNDDEFTLLFEIEVDASDDGQDVYLLETAGAGISVRKLATNYIRLKVENAAGETIVEADSSETLTSADGSTVIAISCRMSTYDVRFMKGTNVDGLLKVTEFTGEAYDNDRNSMNIMSATGGGSGRMAGTLSAVYVSDEFIDLHSVSALNAVVALDGKPDDWGADGSTVTGTQPEFYATGDAAAWNDAGGINLGSDAATAIVTGAVEDVPSGYSPLTINFDSSDYVTGMNGGSGLTTGDEIVIAARITLPASGSTTLLPIFAPASDTALYWWDANGDVIVFRPENTAGGAASLTSPSGYASTTISILAKAILRTASTSDAELYINGSLVASSYDGALNGDPAVRDIKMPAYINSNTGSGADVGFDLVGGMWIGNSGFDDLSYSDFFDGSDQPIFNSATIGGHTAVFFQNGNATAWNAGTNDGSDGNFTMNGAVADV